MNPRISNRQALQEAVSKKMISTADQNLRSKIGSLIKSIENLQEKKSRIEYEIRKQQKSLARKREELKRAHSRFSGQKKKVLSESSSSSLEISIEKTIDRLDSNLLRESDLLL
jgi:predicted  nucleic acid-binding Zn-ribbon protein